MAVLLTLLEQHLDRKPPTVVTQATTWWETVLTLVKLQEIGLGVHLPVKVTYHNLHTVCLWSFHERPPTCAGIQAYTQETCYLPLAYLVEVKLYGRV